VYVRWLIAYTATIVLANWSLEKFGFIEVFPGLMAPAGVLFAGLAFTFRDLLQESKGRWWAVAGIAVGAALSFLISPAFAAASAIAFGCSELADFGIYTPLRKRHWLGAVALSNTVGSLIDGWLFLWIAFGSIAHWQGLFVGKMYMTALAVGVLWVVRRRAVFVGLRPA
jgi:uncharacterized PurR-regulated membrane protein YhhQ (DUF165 family)